MPIPSIEALRAECYRNDAVAVSAIDRINELRDVILNQSPAVQRGGAACAYCGRPGAPGASCVSCGAYVSAPKPPTPGAVLIHDDPDRDGTVMLGTMISTALTPVVIIFVFKLLGLLP